MEPTSRPDIISAPVDLKEVSEVAHPLPDATVDDDLLDARLCVSDRLIDPRGWKGVVYRIWWIASIAGILGGSAVACTRMFWGFSRRGEPYAEYASTSHLLFSLMYLVTTSGGLLITCTYIILGRTDTTIIPCIHAIWYKIFTVLLFTLYAVCMAMSALETRQLKNGIITTLPPFSCDKTGNLCVPVARGHGNSNLRI